MRPMTLLEGKQTLYLEGVGGEPVLSAPIYQGQCAERVRMEARVIERETWATATPHPRANHIGEGHTIEVDRLWVVKGSVPYDYEFVIGRRYVMVLEWEEPGGQWYRRVYYGVTDVRKGESQAISPLNPEQSLAWRAERMEESGGQGVIPAYTGSETPYRVRWVGNGEDFWLFDYNASTGEFREVNAGLSSGRAALENEVDFAAAIQEVPVGWTESGILYGGQFVEAAGIAPKELPRLEFFIGTRRVGSLGAGGVWRVFALAEADIGVPGEGFHFQGGGEVVAVLGLSGLVAEALAEV